MESNAQRSIESLEWSNKSVEVTDNCYFMSKISNVTAFETSQGLVLVDTGMSSDPRFNTSPEMAADLRTFSEKPIHTVLYTHGHIDHIHGLKYFLRDGDDRPRVIAHQNIMERFARYERTRGLVETITARQSSGVDTVGNDEEDVTPYRFPDIQPDTLIEDGLVISVGDLTFEIHHDKGETDDHCWVYCREEQIVCTGDLVINQAPNAGNPQKVQRYPEEWSQALRTMAAKQPQHLCPGHGDVYIDEPDTIQQLLLETATYLESIVEQTLNLLNNGAPPHIDIVHEVEAPEYNSEWLQQRYDEAEFIARNVIRKYGGWWTGRPSELKPARREELATEIATLVGGVDQLETRALELLEEGEYKLATHLADYAFEAFPENDSVQSTAKEVYKTRADAEDSMMSRNILRSAAFYADQGGSFR